MVIRFKISYSSNFIYMYPVIFILVGENLSKTFRRYVAKLVQDNWSFMIHVYVYCFRILYNNCSACNELQLYVHFFFWETLITYTVTIVRHLILFLLLSILINFCKCCIMFKKKWIYTFEWFYIWSDYQIFLAIVHTVLVNFLYFLLFVHDLQLLSISINSSSCTWTTIVCSKLKFKPDQNLLNQFSLAKPSPISFILIRYIKQL